MNDNIDWKEVEDKISLICYRFDNLSSWHDDLAQELRIHAYYVSDNYYDLYRKAIDFWRKIQTKQSPEVPYFDLEVLNPSYTEDYLDQLHNIVFMIKKELSRPGNNKWDNDKLELADKLLDIIVADIDDQNPEKVEHKSKLNPYINKRLNLSYVAEETGINYKRLVSSMKLLEEIVQGLAVMHKIEIPEDYLRDYFDQQG